MMFINFCADSQMFCCGVVEVGAFENTYADYRTGYQSQPVTEGLQEAAVTELNDQLGMGTGLFSTAFIDNPTSKAAFDLFCKEYDLLYQSPLKTNPKSRNKLFTCIFSQKGRK